MIHVTAHAVARFQERVGACSHAAAIAALTSPVVHLAADFGAPFVRLATRHRIVIRGHTVVTVLPNDAGARTLHSARNVGGNDHACPSCKSNPEVIR